MVDRSDFNRRLEALEDRLGDAMIRGGPSLIDARDLPLLVACVQSKRKELSAGDVTSLMAQRGGMLLTTASDILPPERLATIVYRAMTQASPYFEEIRSLKKRPGRKRKASSLSCK